MKEVRVSEDDRNLFATALTPEEYLYYTEQKDAIRCMWKEQGQAFWVNTVIKFRIYILKHGCLAPFNDRNTNGALDYPFLKIATKMTGSFGDITEYLTDVSIVTRNMHLAENMLKPTCAYDPFINATTRNSFRNLFGPPDNKIRILRTYIFSEIFCIWGGALVRLLPIWKESRKVNPAPGLWSPPTSYTRPSPMRYGLFEKYLKKHWKDDIFAVCGAPPQQLIWWSSVPSDGPTSLPPLDEFNTLTEVFELLMSAFDEHGGTAGTKTNKAKKNGGPPPPQQQPQPQPQLSTKADKKRKKKAAKSEKAKTGELAKPKPAAAVPDDESDRFPRPTPAVLAATADWHEYVTALLGTGQLLRNQVLGGALQLGWVVLTMEDSIPRLAHIDPGMVTNVRLSFNKARECWDSAKKALAVKGDASTVALRKERDELSGRINTISPVMSAVNMLRCFPGVNQAADLSRIRSLVRQALGSVLLRLLPAVFQYSATETVGGDPRLVYPDFSRTRYLLRKGLALASAPLPQEPVVLENALTAAIDWYSDMIRLPDQVSAHVRAQLRPGGVLAERLAQEQPYRTDSEKQLEAIDLAKPETFAALQRVFREVVEMSGGDGSGPVPRRPALLLPHTGQSLVDAYWSRLGAMVFVTDLICVIPVSQAVRGVIADFKHDHLNSLFDAVTSLQIAQWRWLYPRSELELPKRPAFCRAASADLLTVHLDHADVVLLDTHRRLQLLCHAVMEHWHSDVDEPTKQLWHMVHFPGDACESTGAGAGGCNDCRQHAFDVANRRVLRGMNQLIRLELKSGVDLEKMVDNLHTVPSFLVAIQDYKAHPTKSAWVAIEKTFDAIVNIAKGVGSFDILHRAVGDITGPGPNNRYPEPRQLGYREASVREFMLTACHELAKRIIVHVHKADMPMNSVGCLKTLKMAGEVLSLVVPASEGTVLKVPGPPPQRLDLGQDWPSLLAAAHGRTADWRRCVESAEAAAGLLTSPGRPTPDAMSTQACTDRSGSESPQRALEPRLEPRSVCLHRGPVRLLCTVLQTLRNIRFMEHVTAALGPGVDITVHTTMLNVLREGWLPYLLAADRLFRLKTAADGAYCRHDKTILATDAWLDDCLTQLYKPRPRPGPGRMLRTDRGSWLAKTVLRPDITLCRTISWSQACDLHMQIMKSLMITLWYARILLPPVLHDGCEAHPTPLALLEQVETGAVLLLAAFLDHRDGRSARQLVDVSELGPQVALALDMHGWLAAVDGMIRFGPLPGEQPEVETTELLQQRTQHALSVYELPLRTGSLLEFLALRQVYAEPLRWVVRAHLQRSGPTHEALMARLKDAMAPVTLLAISELRSQAARDKALPMEWMVRLQQLRRVLLSTTRPVLLDSTLVSLDYQLLCKADQLPNLPTFDGPPDLSDSEFFTAGCKVDPVAFCDHVFDLGAHVLKMQTYLKTYHYGTRNDHIYPHRRFFMKPFGAGQPNMSHAMEKWAAANLMKSPLPGRTGQTELGGLASRAANGTKGVQTTRIQPAAIDSLTRELEGLLISADHLSDIPEEPLEPALLDQAGRHAAQLADSVQKLPDGQLKTSSRHLLACVRRAVSRQTKPDGRGRERQIAGSEMSVVDTCLSMLSSVLSQHGMTVTKPAAACAPKSPALRLCSFCDRREEAAGTFELCSLCVAGGGETEPRAYCGKPCQTDDWEMGHWEDHN